MNKLCEKWSAYTFGFIHCNVGAPKLHEGVKNNALMQFLSKHTCKNLSAYTYFIAYVKSSNTYKIVFNNAQTK